MITPYGIPSEPDSHGPEYGIGNIAVMDLSFG